MRTFFGMILGAALTLAGAFVYDSMNAGTRADGTAERPMVNWDVVGRNAGNWMSKVQSLFSQVTGSAPRTSSDTMEAPRPAPSEPARPN
jgi:hypothetical protein